MQPKVRVKKFVFSGPAELLALKLGSEMAVNLKEMGLTRKEFEPRSFLINNLIAG